MAAHSSYVTNLGRAILFWTRTRYERVDCGALLALFVMQARGAAWVLTLRNASIAFAQILGWVALRERPTARSAAGVALVFGGALALGFL